MMCAWRCFSALRWYNAKNPGGEHKCDFLFVVFEVLEGENLCSESLNCLSNVVSFGALFLVLWQ